MATTPEKISIIIRFGYPDGLPDLGLETDSSTPVLNIKWKIRLAVPVQYTNYSVRLIAGGRLLQDDWDMKRVLAGVPGAGLNNVFLHCSLSEQEPIQNEPNATPSLSQLPLSTEASAEPYLVAGPPGDISPAPIGFDSLRASGALTEQEVVDMRAQFRAQISARYTPDQMPSGDAMLRMEEQWLRGSAFTPSRRGNAAVTDHAEAGETGFANSSGRNSALGTGLTHTRTLVSDLVVGGTNGMGDAAGVETEEDDAARALDDTLFGVLTGFFWPIGAVVWGLREEGVWSRRRGWSVLAGVVVNLGFGVVRVMG